MLQQNKGWGKTQFLFLKKEKLKKKKKKKKPLEVIGGKSVEAHEVHWYLFPGQSVDQKQSSSMAQDSILL